MDYLCSRKGFLCPLAAQWLLDRDTADYLHFSFVHCHIGCLLLLRVGLVLLTLGILNAYVGARLIGRWPWAAAHAALMWTLIAAFFLIQLMAPFGDRMVFPDWRLSETGRLWAVAFDWASYTAFGLLTCAALYSVVADIASLMTAWLSPDTAQVDVDRRALLTLGAATFGTVAAGVTQAQTDPVVRRVEIPLAHLPAAFDGFTITQISDLHIGATLGRDHAQRVTVLANDLKADMVALTGDFIDGHVDDLRDDIAPIKDLQAPQGVYYVTGNHEYYWDAEPWIEAFQNMGFRTLINEHVVLTRGDASLVVAGVADYSTRLSPGPQAFDPHRAFAGAPPSVTRLLLAHQPAGYREAEAEGVDLQLSGHTHAGQYFPFTLLIGLFQKYYKGLNRYKAMSIYVNAGTGYWGPPLRAANPMEITHITLRRA